MPKFIAWDGEGITYIDGQPQCYTLFGISNGSNELYISGRSLSTKECLDFIIQIGSLYKQSVHVSFFFSYDVEMILRDVPLEIMSTLYKDNKLTWEDYYIEYIPTKLFNVTKDGVTTQIWDIFSFFSCSFVKAVEGYLGNPIELQEIEEGKKLRGTFTYDDMDNLVIPYWKKETKLIVKLADKLAELISSAGFEIKEWYGPAVLSKELFKRHKVKKFMNRTLPDEIISASQHAYAGGRFELFKLGKANKKVYKYDINSAYPYAITKLPNVNCNWYWVEYPQTINQYGLYKVEVDNYNKDDLFKPKRLFCRGTSDEVFYPAAVSGWYWGIELLDIQNDIVISEGWEIDDLSTRPMEWMYDVYKQRQQWKKEGKASEKALKLAMNSMYGKMAQRVGWERYNGPPPSHQLEWAGWITAYTRTILYHAMEQAYEKGALISCETDAVFSTEKLDLPIGNNLGEWDYTEFDDLIYIQNGMYWSKQNGYWTGATRGINKNSINFKMVFNYLNKIDLRNQEYIEPLKAYHTQFIGGKLAIHTSAARRLTWEDNVKEIVLGNTGKRVHHFELCNTCISGIYSPTQALHDLLPHRISGVSQPHTLPWLDARQSVIQVDAGAMIDYDNSKTY